MATSTWTAGPGFWNTGGNWTGGIPNSTTAIALINNGGTAETDSGFLFSVATLVVGSRASSVAILDNSALTVQGSITNNGTILLSSGGNVTDLRIGGGQTVTLSGGGSVLLGNSVANYIRDAATGTGKLINVDNLIQGAGSIGNAQLALDNQAAGVIDANLSKALTLQTNAAGGSNEGLIEATSGGTLSLLSSTLTQAGGTLLASGTGSSLALTDSSIIGGMIAAASGGLVFVAAGHAAILTNVTLAAASTLGVTDNSVLSISGSLLNLGTVALNSVGNVTELRIAGGQIVTLSGGGSVLLGNNTANYIRDAAASTGKLVNVDNLIQGAGKIGNGQLALDNRAAGVIDANLASALTIQTNVAGGSNEGLIEATAGGTLQLLSTTLAQAGGTLLASGTGSSLALTDSSITGGTIVAASGGLLFVAAGHAATLTNVTLAAASTLGATDNSVLNISGSLQNLGTIALNSAGNPTSLRIADGGSLTGGGVISLGNIASNQILGVTNSGTETVTNVNETIQGAGKLGFSNSFEFINQGGGTVNASGTLALVVTPTTAAAVVAAHGGGFVNLGLMEATNTGGLVLNGGQFNNAGGTILAAVAGHNVTLENGAIVSGGLLASIGGGYFQTYSGSNATLDGSSEGALTLTGLYQAADNSTTSLSGIINASGTLALNSIGNSTDLLVANGTTLQGGGVISLSSSNGNQIFGVLNTGTETVTNVNETIQGAGKLGASNSFEFINRSGGTVNASGTLALVVTPTTGASIVAAHGGGFVNLGLMEATNTGGLVLNGGQFNNAGGTILAAGSGDNVTLENAATISGGLLAGNGGGIVQTVAGQFAVLDGASNGALTLAGLYQAADNSTTSLSGVINETGTLSLNSLANTTILQVANGTTLQGGGVLALSDSANNKIMGFANTGTEVLTNLNDTIQGAGKFGFSNSIGIVNSGTIRSTGVANALVVAPSVSGGLTAGLVNTAGGVIQSGSGSAGLIISQGSVANQGTIEALDNSTLTFSAGVINQNAAGGTLTGGSWAAIETTSGKSAILLITGGAITTDAANITLSGSGASIRSTTLFTIEDIQGSLATIAAAGQLNVLAGASYSTANNLANAGLLTLGGGSFATANLANSGTLSGFGRLAVSGGTLANTGQVVASGGTLELAESVSGAGTLAIAALATLQLDAAIAGGVAISFQHGSPGVLTLGDIAAFAGTVTASYLGDKFVVTGGTLSGLAVSNANTLTMYDSGGGAAPGGIDTIVFSAPISASDFSIVNSNTVQVMACYAAGTRILTARGEVAVEALRVGEPVVSAFGGTVPVTWLGHRRVACNRHPRPHDAWPVRVSANAFATGRPARDLVLSPDHSLFIDDVLIPVRYLINGATIVQEPVDSIDYYHVELPAHDVLLAEGLPAESYLDTGNRGAFENGGAAVMLHPDFALRVWEAEACARLVIAGGEVRAVRRRLHDRALAQGHAIATDAALRLDVDGVLLVPEIDGAVHRFRLPPAARSARLRSCSGVAAQLDLDTDDHRRLGVALACIRLDDARVALDDPRLGAGWHAVESTDASIWRWTDGDAVLAIDGQHVLEVVVAMAARSWRSASGQATVRAA